MRLKIRLEDIGFGLYRIKGWEHRISPQLIFSMIPGRFTSSQREKVVTLLISFSVQERKWVGVTRELLIEKIRKFVNSDEDRLRRLVLVLDQMIEDDILEIPGAFKNRWLRWLNFFITQIVCPTNFLLCVIQGDMVVQDKERDTCLAI